MNRTPSLIRTGALWSLPLLVAAILAVIFLRQTISEAWQGTGIEEAQSHADAHIDVATRLATVRSRSALDAALHAAGARAAAREARRLVSQVEISAAAAAASSQIIAQVRYKLRAEQDVHTVCSLYGLDLEELSVMNPTQDLGTVAEGDELVIYRRPAEHRSYSRGTPNRGRLVDGVPMPENERAWIVKNPRYAWGTASTVRSIVLGMRHVAAILPGGTIPMVADLSRRDGGRLRPHRSHQSGRDADITYFDSYPGPAGGFRRETSYSLDYERQWELFTYWIERDMVEYIFVDRRLIRGLSQYATSIGASPSLMEMAFGRSGRHGIIRHEPGHSDHLHVRFQCAEHDRACHSL
jgi:hypothetical protein